MGVKTKFTSTIMNPWRRYISINNNLQLWKALGDSGCLGDRTRKESHGVWVCVGVCVHVHMAPQGQKPDSSHRRLPQGTGVRVPGLYKEDTFLSVLS